MIYCQSPLWNFFIPKRLSFGNFINKGDAFYMKKRKGQTLAQKTNVIRAAVMGANDGILSVAGIVLGVAGAGQSNYALFLAGISGMLAGTVSMAMGEYVSVNSEKDSQKMAVIKQKQALEQKYTSEFNFVKQKYLNQGIKEELAHKATQEMMNSNPLITTVRERYGFNADQYTSPYAAALASMLSFPTGSILPLGAITLFPESVKNFATFVAVIVALAITGYLAALINGADRARGIWRNVISGTLTMLVTFTIGKLIS